MSAVAPLEVRPQGKRFGVYRGDELIEGGFFRRAAAEVVAAYLTREAVERLAAERARRLPPPDPPEPE